MKNSVIGLKSFVPEQQIENSLSRYDAQLIWHQLKGKCYSFQNKNYKNYGAKGIKVCKRWHDFNKFYNDIVPMYFGYGIHRYNVYGEFSPLNCYWGRTKNLKKKPTREDRYKKLAIRNHLDKKKYEQLISLVDINKIEFLDTYMRTGKLKKTPRRYKTKDWYLDFMEKFYYDAQFNKIYKAWLDSGKDSKLRPSLDHIVPKIKGGKDNLENLQFLTWFENRCKWAYSQEEWDEIKKNIYNYFI